MEYYCKKGQENFYELLKTNALNRGDEVCFDFYDYSGVERRNITITRSELFEKSCKIAKLLRKQGAKKGDKVVIFSTQTADNVLSSLASILAGTVFTIIPPPIDSNKMMRFISVLESCKPKFLLCTLEIKTKLSPIFEKIRGDATYKSLLDEFKIITVEESNNLNEILVPEVITLDDIIYLQYSSGSTSAPKGVEITYGNLISNLNICLESYDLKRVFAWVPFFHNIGLVYLMFGPVVKLDFCAGVMSPAAFLERPVRWIEGISEYKADVTVAPNSAFESYPKLVPPKTLKNIDLSNLKSAHAGAEIVTYSALEKFSEAYKEFGFNIEKFVTGYGLAEVTCAISTSFVTKKSIINIDFNEYQKGKMVLVDENHENKIQFISGGEILKHNIVKIVNPDTNEICREDEFGEIWVQGVTVAKGYYNNVVGTEETFKGELKGYEGNFLRTGDLGIIRDNHIFITGRAKELIIINGNNILPNDIINKIKESLPVLEYVRVVPFSIFHEEKERLVVVLEIPDKIINDINISNLVNEMSSCIYEFFEISPYDIAVIKEGTLPKSDNGKISVLGARNAYLDKKLQITSSRGNTSVEETTYETETEEKLLGIIKEELSYKAKRKDNLLNLGMDSLAIVELATIIENKFSVVIPVSYIFENPTIEFLGEYIDKTISGEDLSKFSVDKSYLYDECKLDEDIKFKEYNDNKPTMKNVLVTGTTGFVGAYLIHTLLNQSEAIIYCHVRAKDEEHGFNRIKENMEYYKLWSEEYSERIIPILGSVDKPLLGIEPKLYKVLTKTIDTVYHNGAILNFIYPYKRLKTTNVYGTVESIRFSSLGKSKHYNYVSSYSVFDTPSYFGKNVLEDDKLENCKGYFLAYSETKWVSEKIIDIARKRGLKAAIYRPGEITGANDTGIWKYSDSVSRTFKSILEGKVCANIGMKFHMTQVDYIGSAIVAISKKEESYGKAFNLLNELSIPLSRLGEMIGECGYEVSAIDYDQWKESFFKAGSEHPLRLLESLFRVSKEPGEDLVNRYGEKGAILDTSNAVNALRGTGISCEPMNVELIRKYIKNFI